MQVERIGQQYRFSAVAATLALGLYLGMFLTLFLTPLTAIGVGLILGLGVWTILGGIQLAQRSRRALAVPA
jgi:putative Mn2+ efflux pump MntP